MNFVMKKFGHIKYLNEKGRFLLFALFLFLLLFLSIYLFQIAYARYEMRTKLYAHIDKAIYMFESEKIQFNLEPTGIIPRDEPYVYRFSVSNFVSSKESDVDLLYNVKLRTTTNLPLQIELYRNELYTDSGASSVFNGAELVQDVDGAWYNIYDAHAEYEMFYEDRTTDVYSLVIYFPSSYATDVTYANYIENIEVILESKQVI